MFDNLLFLTWFHYCFAGVQHIWYEYIQILNYNIRGMIIETTRGFMNSAYPECECFLINLNRPSAIFVISWGLNTIWLIVDCERYGGDDIREIEWQNIVSLWLNLSRNPYPKSATRLLILAVKIYIINMWKGIDEIASRATVLIILMFWIWICDDVMYAQLSDNM